MNAREKILGRLRDARPADDSSAIKVQQHLAWHPRGPLPPPPTDLVAHFVERALKLSSDVLKAAERTEIPGLLATYLAERALPLSGVCWPQLADLPWDAAGLTMQIRPASNLDLVGVTGAFCAIAETGTLLLLGGEKTPATTSLLPETHVAIVDPARIVASMEDAWALLRSEFKEPPRTVNFISGPSRTADIEQTVTLGAHGPYRVLLILCPV